MSERQPLFSMEELHQIRHALEMLVQQKDQIRRAVEALKAAERYDLRPQRNYMGDGMVRDDKHGEWTEAQILDTVLKILSEDAGAKHEQAETHTPDTRHSSGGSDRDRE